jgi:hypothetical protein
MGRLFGARFASWIASNEAKAEVAKRAIETQAEIDHNRALTDNRRRTELEEIEHEGRVALAHRRLDRMLIEMAYEQASFEAIYRESLRLIEHAPDGDNAREIDDDWMFKFARFAQHVSDTDVQRLWAKILSSAAIEVRPKLSAAALQIMSLLDKKAAGDFEKFVAVVHTLGLYPAHGKMSEREPQNIDLANLKELGLLDYGATTGAQKFKEFELFFGQRTGLGFNLLIDQCSVTQRGAEVANAAFGRSPPTLNLSVQEKYLQEFVTALVEQALGQARVAMVPTGADFALGAPDVP